MNARLSTTNRLNGLDYQHLSPGDSTEFADAFYQYHAYLYNIAIGYLKRPELAENAVQDVFLKLWFNRDRISEYESLREFLAVAMRSQVLMLLRDEKRTVLRFLDEQPVLGNGYIKTPAEDQLQVAE